MPSSLPLSGVVITCNEADRIERCVASMRELCAEVLVIDSGSSDDTVAVARAAGARVEHQEWLGFSGQKNTAISLAANPWVLLLDADEWLAPSTSPRIRQLFESGKVERADVWRLPRRTRFLGHTLQFGGWGNEWLERLFRRDCRYLPALVHERLDLRGKRVRRVKARIEHDTARSLAEYRAKLDRYATLSAHQKLEAGRVATPLDRYIHAAAYWLKNYILRGGFIDGRVGFVYHGLHTRYVYDKYDRLWRLQRSEAA